MRIITEYCEKLKMIFNEEDLTIDEIKIGDDRILWGVWSIFNDYKNSNIRLAIGKGTPKRWRLFWKRYFIKDVSEWTGKVIYECTEDGKNIARMMIGDFIIIYDSFSIFNDYNNCVVHLEFEVL